MRSSAVLAIALSAGLASAQCGSSGGSACGGSSGQATVSLASFSQAPDIVDTAVAAGSFNTLVAAVKAAGLVDVLKGPGPFTVFAPSDEAFAKLPAGTVENLLKPENKQLLATILTYHVVPGRVAAKDVVRLRSAGTVSGQRVEIRVKDGAVMIDNAKVATADIETSNGIIHVIDTVIMPTTKSIPEVASEAGSFSTLLKAVAAAGLDKTLMGEGPFTVLAPTDEAFGALGATVADLLKPENRKQLTDILTYHVIPGRVFAADAIKAGSAKTVQGGEVNFAISEARLVVNNATIIGTDVDASNGVIHIIDSVLLPN